MKTDDIYFTAEHGAFREMVRRFVLTEMAPYVDAWEAAAGFPRELYRKCGALGLLGLGHAEEYGGSPSTDIFHLLILGEEMVISGLC
ncbi:MAG: acyl-CoA dehydrogenase family protein, partial [Gaiellaceae bacterium]